MEKRRIVFGLSRKVNPLVRMLSLVLFALMAVQMYASTEHAVTVSVTSEAVSKSVPFTYKTESKTLNVTTAYTLYAEQLVNTNYDHAIFRLSYADLAEAVGFDVNQWLTKSTDISNMLYFPLTDGEGIYGHNNDNWFDADGYRSSYSASASKFFIQPRRSDELSEGVFVIWTGQHATHASAVGSVYTSIFYLVNGTDAVELNLTLKVVEEKIEVIDAGEFNLENMRVQGFLNDFIYDTESVSRIGDYNLTPPARRDQPAAVTVVWQNVEDNAPQYVLLKEKDAEAEAVRILVEATDTAAVIWNLLPGKTYEYEVVGETGVLRQGQFETIGQLRMLWTEQLANLRDLGGWMTESGQRVQYGLLFRGSELNGQHTASATDMEILRGLGIRAELDLRTDDEAEGITASPLGDDVAFLRVSNTPYYLEGARDHVANYRKDFQFILQNLREGRPVLFHCIWGADRTGTLGVLLEGLLGMAESDIYKDYELSSMAGIEGAPRTKVLLADLMTFVKAQRGTSLREKFFYYWLDRVGVEASDLDAFCSIMLGAAVETEAVALQNVAPDCCNVTAHYTASWNNLYTIFDGAVGYGELTNDKTWASWAENRPAEGWLSYEWAAPMELTGCAVWFWTDTETAGDHVAVPASWRLQYMEMGTHEWKDVTLLDGAEYACGRKQRNAVQFEPVQTQQLRLLMEAQGNGTTYSALGVTEWEVYGKTNEAEVAVYGGYPIQNVDFSQVHLDDNFWSPRMEQNQTVTIPIAIQQCYDTGRVLNFQKAAAILRGENIGYFNTECTFDDTDIYKILEGMAYSVQTKPNADLDRQMDELIGIIAAAQEEDGYLYTARTAGEPGNMHAWVGTNRWEKDPDLSHELYNCGHLYEAAVAHYISTGKRTLLDVAIKNADLLVKDFLEGGLTYEPGHQIVEMGLVKMYRVTGKKEYLALAKYFLDLRGTKSVMHKEYSQTHKPVVMQDEAVGHAVRAAYMYAGMADIAAIMGNSAYLRAVDQLWENVAEKKLYVTGGIGARHDGEAFGDNYELPNETAYCETCAAIANIYWNWRMFLLHGESKYYDVIERTLYNGAISGIGLEGNRFFYPNPLASDGAYERSAWFGCACCPSNLCRFTASVPGYVYAHKGDSIYVNLYMQGTATIPMEKGSVQLRQTTEFPWQGAVSIEVKSLETETLTLMLRLPGWAKGVPVPSDLYTYMNANVQPVKLLVNGTEVEYVMENGYMVVEREWQVGDVISFELPMEVKRTLANEQVKDDEGRVALERGPIVYCLEWADNDDVASAVINDEASITATWADRLNGVMTLNINGQSACYDGMSITTKDALLTAIPYYAWANRGKGLMEVWIPRTADKAQAKVGDVALTDTIHLQVDEVLFTNTAAHIYDSTPVSVDKELVAQSLGMTADELDGAWAAGTLVFAAIEPDGTPNETSTATAPGHWFAADGSVTTWASGEARFFSEFNKQTCTFSIGQYPARCKEGDTYTFQQAITNMAGDADGHLRRCLFSSTLRIIVPTGMKEKFLPTQLTAEGWYTLTGVKLGGKPTAKGVYLYQGKKVAVR